MSKTFRTGKCLQEHLLWGLSTGNQNSVKIRAFCGGIAGAGITLNIAYKISAKYDAPLNILARYNIELHLLNIPTSNFTLDDNTLAMLKAELELFLSYCHSSMLRGLLPLGGFTT